MAYERPGGGWRGSLGATGTTRREKVEFAHAGAKKAARGLAIDRGKRRKELRDLVSQRRRDVAEQNKSNMMGSFIDIVGGGLSVATGNPLFYAGAKGLSSLVTGTQPDIGSMMELGMAGMDYASSIKGAPGAAGAAFGAEDYQLGDIAAGGGGYQGPSLEGDFQLKLDPTLMDPSTGPTSAAMAAPFIPSAVGGADALRRGPRSLYGQPELTPIIEGGAHSVMGELEGGFELAEMLETTVPGTPEWFSERTHAPSGLPTTHGIGAQISGPAMGTGGGLTMPGSIDTPMSPALPQPALTGPGDTWQSSGAVDTYGPLSAQFEGMQSGTGTTVPVQDILTRRQLFNMRNPDAVHYEGSDEDLGDVTWGANQGPIIQPGMNPRTGAPWTPEELLQMQLNPEMFNLQALGLD